ncbi:hypothetical protein WKI72_03385 [Candidatus Erwinia dacicola]|uniref:Uncharacterized protein n=1 Tax=Candidatus Erwinia dacicola TaxID=252393 RepID=A0A328TM21_9GAMM|nr:hypothetical protein ACZ87_01758 [Candidatus Erwinia dacicola]RAP71673.1 hypothetical protein ACZ87_01508 [Candidatus Erwinia dacicola]
MLGIILEGCHVPDSWQFADFLPDLYHVYLWRTHGGENKADS